MNGNGQAEQAAVNITPLGPSKHFLAGMSERYGIEQQKLWGTLKATAFKVKDGAPTDAQMNALMIVANEYGLNPFTKEIYAFPDKQNGIVPVVGVDGWLRIANSHPMMDGYEIRASEKLVQIDDDAKECPEWMEGVIFRKDRTRPIVVREYLDECYRPAFSGTRQGGGAYKVPGPWQSHTKRMLRHKALIQSLRTAFGFAGVYEEDEAQRIIEARVVDTTPMIDMEPSPDTSEFDRLAGEAGLLTDSKFMEFLGLAAKNSGVTVGALKEQAAGDFDRLEVTFQGWLAKQQPATPKRNVPTREEMQARRETVKAELEALGVFEAVAKAMGDKGRGTVATWNTQQCQQALDLGKELAAQQQEQPQDVPAPNFITCPNAWNEEQTENLTIDRSECAGCTERPGCAAWGTN